MKRAADGLQSHERLLAACAFARVDDESRRAVDAALSAPDIDWPAACALSVRHGLAQHAALHLRGFADDPRIPPNVAAAFARMYDGNARRNAVLFRETARVLRALDNADIRCLLLKGVPLALTVYPDPALRNFADVDLLVDVGDFDAALRVAETCGFRPTNGATEPLFHEQTCVRICPEDVLTDTVAWEFEPTITPELLTRYRHRVVLEIHRGLFRDPSGLWRDADLGLFWESPQTAALPDGTPFQLPAPEAHLVYLAAHAGTHVFKRLMYLLDIAEAIRRDGPALDWDRVIDLARHWEVTGDVWRALEIVRREFRACVPLETLHRLAPGPPEKWDGKVLTLADVFRAQQADRSDHTLRRWLLAPNARQRARALWHLLVPPPTTMRRVYGVQNGALVAALYLFRPFHLAGRLARVLANRLRAAGGVGRF